MKLADIYQGGRFEDQERARQAFDDYARACPDRLVSGAEWVMGKVASPATQIAIAKAMRARLERETGPHELRAYPALWGLEFRTRPPQELLEGRWENPSKTLPAFELADLSGQTWKLKQLEGRALLINLWATWCGPCRAELPQLEKLYRKTKDRTDLQVITFNVDDEVGLVEPYMKENNYTFPVLLAYGLVRGMFDGYGIPQNWIVNPRGQWIATQIGFDASDADRVNTMMQRLAAARQGN